MSLEVNKRFVLVVLFINVVILIAILMTVLVAVPELTQFKTKLCLPPQEGSGLLCGSSQEVLPDFLEQMLDKAYEESMKEENERDEETYKMDHSLYKYFLFIKPAARYSANIQTKDLEKQGSSELMTTITEWEPENDLENKYEFQRFKLTYKDGRIVVRVSGTYLVYSFLDLYEELKPNDTYSNRDRPIMHGIYVFNFTERAEKELVTSCHLHQSTSNRRFNIYSSFVMTLVDLRAGDEVMVKVNDLSLLQYPVFNTFGLNLV